MVVNREPKLDDDGENRSPSSFQRTVILKDWWLVKCSKEFKGKRFGVAGTEIAASVYENRAMRVFTSSPIIKAFDIFTLQASDGICITLRGFLDKKRVVESGFSPEISREFIFGFPPCWEKICNKCFGGGSFGTDKACRPISSPCKDMKENLEDSPAESRAKSTMGRMSPRLQSKFGGKSAEGVMKFESSKVQNRISDGDHGSEGLDKATSSYVETYECEAIKDSEVIDVDKSSKHGKKEKSKERKKTVDSGIDVDKSSKHGKKEKSKERKKTVDSGSNAVKLINHSETKFKTAENKRKLNASKVQNPTKEGDHGSEGLNNVKSSDVGKDECLAIDNEVASVVVGCGKGHTGADNIDKTTSKNAAKGKLKVTKTSLHSLSKDLNNSSKPGKKGKSKKGEKMLESEWNVVEPITYSGSKVKEAGVTMSLEKTKRKIDFDLEAKVTPDKEPKKQKTDADSPGSLGQKRSRSGRVLMSPLEFWRNQVPVYDTGKNLIQVDEGHEPSSTTSKGNRSGSRKARR